MHGFESHAKPYYRQANLRQAGKGEIRIDDRKGSEHHYISIMKMRPYALHKKIYEDLTGIFELKIL